MRALHLLVALLLAAPAGAQSDLDAARSFFKARSLCKSGDIPGCVAALEDADRLGDGMLPPHADGFEKAWNDPAFQRVRAHMEARLPRLDFAPNAIEIDDRRLIPEGIAWDAASGAFFIGSTTQGRIVRVGFGNALSEFAPRQEGLDCVLGLAVDAPRRLLYAVSTSAPTARGRERRLNAIVAWDIDKHRLVRRVEVPDAQQLNDVTVAIGGRVFASDSASGAIFEIPREGPARTLVAADKLRGSNGLAASPDGKRLYVAHSTGLALVDPSTGNVQRVANTTRESIAAIDGLYDSQGELIGVQNVTTPGRVIAIALSRDGTTVTRVRTLLSHHHNVLDEPTTGAVTDHGFFLLAATGVRHLNDNGTIDDPDTVPRPTVVRVLLPR
ncbi:MAG: SMP-30/gluconolactonase/LRE family protein [Usitatibacter sp.]